MDNQYCCKGWNYSCPNFRSNAGYYLTPRGGMRLCGSCHDQYEKETKEKQKSSCNPKD